MHFLTTDEFSEVLEDSSMSVFPSLLAYSAYEQDSREPSPDELVQVYYSVSALL
jgi:hypothetical protein